MSSITKLDAAVLGTADASVAWLWSRWGVGRRTVLAMLLLAWVATELASEIAIDGHVSLLDAAVFGALLAVRGVSDHRTPAGVTAARRDTPLVRVVRLICWPLAAWDAFRALFLPVAGLGLAAAVLFLAYIYASDTLTPKGPRGPKRREKLVSVGSTPVFGR